eukprot:PITA_30432
MWYGHVPSVKDLRVFRSTCYALIPKVHRNKLGARSRKCIFLGYSNTSKAYRLYDEVNKKFVVSRDLIFLESSKSDNVVERQLDRLDRFAKMKSFQEFENQIPHLEGGIPIVDQHVESSSEEDSPPSETPTTDDALSDVWHDKCNPLTTPMEQNLKLTSIEGKEFEDATNYRQLVGSLNYLTTTRLDISFVVGILSRFMQKACEGHWFAAKRVLRYLKGTQDFGIKYTQVDDFSLVGYSDSDFDGDKESGVSTSGYAMSLGSRAVS